MFATSDRRGAIAYSPATRRYWGSYQEASLEAADQAALRGLGENDGIIAIHGVMTWLALAVSAEGYYAACAGGINARTQALQACRGTNCRIVLDFHTMYG
jgi:hypothetical protein